MIKFILRSAVATAALAAAKKLYDAAAEPKELQWYSGGHWPPQSVIEHAADWVAARFAVTAAQELMA